MQVVKVLIAAGEQAAERREVQIAGFRDRSRFFEGVQNHRPENTRDQIIWAGERLRGIKVDRLEPCEMIGLGGARRVRWREFCVAFHAERRRDDDEIAFGAVLVEADREPRFPLGIGQAPKRLAVHALFGQPSRKLGLAPQKVVDAARRWRRAGHLAREMHDDVAALDIIFEHGERVAAPRLEVFLDFDFDIRSRQRTAQRVAIIAEFVRYTREKELDVRHSPPPALWPWPQCGMVGRLRQRARCGVMRV